MPFLNMAATAFTASLLILREESVGYANWIILLTRCCGASFLCLSLLKVTKIMWQLLCCFRSFSAQLVAKVDMRSFKLWISEKVYSKLLVVAMAFFEAISSSCKVGTPSRSFFKRHSTMEKFFLIHSSESCVN